MTTEIHLQWDTAFLEQYIKEQMVPRGLRWDVFPQQGDSDIESWFRYFNEVGIKLLGFLIDRKKLKLSIIDKEIKDLKEKLGPFKTSSEYISLYTSLKDHLKKWLISCLQIRFAVAHVFYPSPLKRPGRAHYCA